MEKAITVNSRGRGPGMFKKIMAEVAAPRRGRYLQNNMTINPWGHGYIIKKLLTWSDARARLMSR